VDAYTDQNVESDLATFDQQYGLPACTTSNGCLTILNQAACTKKGGTKNNPCAFVAPDWNLETSLDVEVAHAICQTCKIVLSEAVSVTYDYMGAAENAAVQAGATVVTNSWGGTECYCETQYDGYWNHPGTAIVFSSGDSGNVVEYPAASPYVLAVGGTTLNLNPNNTLASEVAWNSGGSGCSVVEGAPSWQTSLPTWSQTGCGLYRATADVAADADPNTGAAVYDSTPYNGQVGWFQVGGTSMAAPIVAAAIALAGGTSGASSAGQIPYLHMNLSNSHDVTAGSNGACSTIMCAAVPGYDGPTGLGTPNGVSGL
jgi:subtilase family serine protease